MHSDRGSQYCSNDYQTLLKKHNFTCSMSRKGNCWDNAPMESFWGKLKQEWLNDQHFRTHEEAKAAIFFVPQETTTCEQWVQDPGGVYDSRRELLNRNGA